ncbi:MAG: 3'-5' exonuclease [Clostridium sp.]|nr:3'-5' exonuclease [Clostridium sp.]
MEEKRKETPAQAGNSYLALDLETTGLDPKRDKIIEIGACRVRDGKIEKELSLLIHPHQPLPERITALTGITDEMLSEAPDMESVIGQVMDFCGDLPILGHHVIFDYSFLKRAAVNAGFPFERTGIDTLGLCRRFMPEEEKKNLSAACAWYQVPEETAHRALSDARMAHFLYQKIRALNISGHEETFLPKPLIYKVKREQPASKKQKEGLRELAKYHRINLSVDIEYLTRSEASRMTDKIIFQYGRMKKR